MQRGHLSTIEFLRGILSPCFRKNLTTASIKYAEEKDKKKVDGMFSWLKDMLRPGKMKKFLRHLFFLFLFRLEKVPNVSIRSIISCTRRNTNPPIREPNMPEKQQKKDEKKEKKKKKPVIRMEDEISEICTNEIATDAKNNLHDNLDVNFRYHRGLRLPEEGENTVQMWNGNIQQLESIHCVNDTNYSSYETMSVYNMDAIQTMKNLQLSMSSAKDSEKELSKMTLANQELMNTVESGSTDAKKKDTENTENLKEVLKNPTNETKETTVTDEDYNVPNSTAFDAEISAWKDLVMKSKIPMDPSKEEYLDGENPGSSRRVDMLSIRPEPPQPKLDVQAVPSSEDEMMKEEEEESDVSKDLKGNLKATDVKLTRENAVDVQKTNSKKLHTGSFFSSRRYGMNNFQGRLKLHDSLRTLEFMDNDVSFFTSNYSTSTESSGWDRLDKSVAKEKDIGGEEIQSGREELTTKSQPDLQENRMESLERNEVALDSKHDSSINFKHEEQDVDKNFGDNISMIPDDEIDSTLNQKVNRDTRESYRVSQRGSRKFETDDYMDAKFQDVQDNYDYTNSLYEDDFYPGYESMSLEPTTEKPVSSQPEEQQSQSPIITRSKEQKIFVNSEMFPKGENRTDKDQYVTEGSYVKWPGDPYPYSREHFDKWKLPHSDIQLGAPANADELHETLLNTPAPSSSSDKRMDMQPPARKMSFYSRLRGSVGKTVCK
ncbi:hypothetical protein ANTPLA_LOCUS4694 [Anthophora plagiata]